MCTAIQEFQPEIQAARQRRYEVLARLVGRFNVMALFRRRRVAPANPL